MSFATVTGVPVGILSEYFSLAFLISTGIVKELLKSTRNKKNKHNKIVLLATSKLNSTESKISEALINNEISHEDFMTIIKEKKIYRELKKVLEWWILRKVMLIKLTLLKKAKQKIGIMKLLNTIKLLITI